MALWTLVALIALYRFHQAQRGVIHGVDFSAVWDASRHLAHGGALYDEHGFGFVYLPSAALLFLPAELVTFDLARDLWAISALVALAASCAVIVRAWRGPSWLAPVSAAIMVGSGPALGVDVGNVDLILPLLLALCVVAVIHEQWTRVGLLSGLSIAIKPLVLAPVLLLAWERRWKAAGWSIAVPVALSIPVLFVVNQVSTFVNHTVPFLLGSENQQVQKLSLAVASVLRHQPHMAQLVARFGVLVLTCIAAVLVWRRTAPHAVRWLEVVAVLQSGLALMGSFGFGHHVALVLLLIPAAAAPQSLARRRPVLLALLVLACPKALPGTGDLGHALAVQQCIALILVLATTAVCAAREGLGLSGLDAKKSLRPPAEDSRVVSKSPRDVGGVEVLE